MIKFNIETLTLEVLLILASLIMASSISAQPVPDPDPLRFEYEINIYKEWDLKNSTPQSAVLFVGSSSIRMWHTAAAFPGYPLINRGFGGSHISDVLHYYDFLIRKYNPELIVFYAGDNDIAADKPVDQVFDDYTELIARIMDDLPATRFLYIPVKPSASRWNYWESMNRLNHRIRRFNSEHEQLFYTDLATPLLDDNGEPDERYFMEDHLHLNEQGYKVWNNLLTEDLNELMR